MSTGTATIVRDIFHLIARASAQTGPHPDIFCCITKFQVTVSAVTQNAMSTGKIFVYDSNQQPHYFSYIFYGIFNVNNPNSTIDSIDVVVKSIGSLLGTPETTGAYTIELYLMANVPLIINQPGLYGIMLVYEYQPPPTANITIQ
jgi:hypothetical protein